MHQLCAWDGSVPNKLERESIVKNETTRRERLRYCLYRSNPKFPTKGKRPVRESENLDDLREFMFGRRDKAQHTLTEHGERINRDALDIEVLTDLRSTDDKSYGSGWYCANPKCGKLIAVTSDSARAVNKVKLVRMSCPHCDHHYLYRTCDYKRRKWKA